MRSLACVLAALTLPFLVGCGDLVAERVAFGDSVTFGYGGQRGGWVSHLERGLDEPVANFGVPTETVSHARARFVGATGPLAMAPWSAEILLLHGGNDLAGAFLGAKCKGECAPEVLAGDIEEIAGDLGWIIDQARAHRHNVIVGTYWRVNAEACSTGPLTLREDEVIRANAAIDALNARIVAMAYERRLPVVRLDALALEHDAALFYDCIHPSDEGYRRIAAAWRAALD